MLCVNQFNEKDSINVNFGDKFNDFIDIHNSRDFLRRFLLSIPGNEVDSGKRKISVVFFHEITLKCRR